MKADEVNITSVDTYINSFPPATKKQMEKLRSLIRKAAPKAEELISYKMPAYKLHGVLVYFAGYDHHVGFYPMPSAIDKFYPELSKYKKAKGTVQFPIDETLPAELITRMVKFRVDENMEKASLKTRTAKKK